MVRISTLRRFQCGMAAGGVRSNECLLVIIYSCIDVAIYGLV